MGGVRMKNFNVMGGPVQEKPIYRGHYLKRGAWTICSFEGGVGLAKKRRLVFLGDLIPQCLLCEAKLRCLFPKNVKFHFCPVFWAVLLLYQQFHCKIYV